MRPLPSAGCCPAAIDRIRCHPVDADPPLVRIAKLQLEVRRDVDRDEARRQIAGADVGHVRLRRPARRGMPVGVDVTPAHRREAMVRRHEQIGRRGELRIALQRRQDPAQGLVGVVNRGLRRRSVDARSEVAQAVALVVLGGVRIARPEDQHERLSALLEFGEDHLGDRVGEELLLTNVGHPGSGILAVARIAVVILASSPCRSSAPAASRRRARSSAPPRSPDRAARLSLIP